MINKIRIFIARIVDTRMSEAVADIHRSMSHLEMNNEERQKKLIEYIDKRACETERQISLNIRGLTSQLADIRVQLTDDLPAEIQLTGNRILKSDQWASLSNEMRQLFASQVADISDDPAKQADFEMRCFTQFYPAALIIDNLRDLVRSQAGKGEI